MERQHSTLPQNSQPATRQPVVFHRNERKAIAAKSVIGGPAIAVVVAALVAVVVAAAVSPVVSPVVDDAVVPDRIVVAALKLS